MATSPTKVTIKLLIDTKSKRVLFAEAGKDFVDFLFNLLHLPVGTVVRLLTKEAMVGTLGNLYDSIETLSNTYFQANKTKQSVLNPKAHISSSDANSLLLLDDTSSSEAKTFYVCNASTGGYNFHLYVSNDDKALCPQCRNPMGMKVAYVTREGGKDVASAAGKGGYVRGVVTYMVMDDLVVAPMSTISSITLLNKFNVKEVGALEEKVVNFGMPEGLKLLRASLHSKKVLTTVFL